MGFWQLFKQFGVFMATNSLLLAFCNCPDEKTAQDIAYWLVEDRLAACVNILPAVQSIYRWQGKLETDSEVTLLIKTDSPNLELIKGELPSRHPYELPELITVCIKDGLPPYLRWLEQSLAKN